MPTETPERPLRRHRTVDRVAMILDVAARSRSGRTLTQLASAIEAPISSTQALVNGLVATGFLEEAAPRTYILGTAPYLLNLLAGRRMVSEVGHDVLERLHERSGLTAVLATNVGDDVFYVDHASDDEGAEVTGAFVRSSLLHSSTGMVLLAGMPPSDAWAYLRSLPVDEAWRVERFYAMQPEIVATGICTAPGVSPEGDGVAIAVEVGERTVSAVGLIGPPAEIRARAAELAQLLRYEQERWSRSF
jgi:DNA-binding IclR family transcriptional regulator